MSRFNFKKWIADKFEGDFLFQKIDNAAMYLGCSHRTARRLYDGYQPKHIKVYENLAKLK